MAYCSPLNSCYQIYSIGDSGFLRQILDAVAGITSSGSFAGACGIGLLLGVFITLFRSLFSGAQKIDFGVIFVSFLLYGLLFVPKTTVLIEDVYTGVVYTVDSVPVGIAAPGHIISEVGFKLSESVDQAFAPASSEYGITRRPFLETLTVISRLRDEDFLNSIWARLQESNAGDDVKSSVKAFWRDCVMLRYQFAGGSSLTADGDRSLSALISEFPSRIYGTVYYTGSGPVEATCREASVRVHSWLEKLTPDLIDRSSSFSSLTDASHTTSDLLGSSLEMLGASAVSTTRMVQASLLLPLYQKSSQDYYHSKQDFAAGAMIGQALMQRNIQWAAEQSVFMTTIRPFVTFFEGFIYAIAPFMAILICVGGFGLSVAIRYFQTLIWIQLWMPILCIINLYICSGFRSEVGRYLTGSRVWDSPAVLQGIHDSLQNWMATAGMLAAATPLIALFIVTASTYTFTTLAGRMGGGDHVDEKIMSPDLVSQPPLMTNEHSAMVMTGTGGVLKSRASQLPSISFGSSDSRALSRTFQSGIGRTLADSRALNESWLKTVGDSHGFDRTESIQDVISSAGNTVLSSVWKQSLQEAERTGTDATSIFASTIGQLTGASVSAADGQTDQLGIGVKASGSATGSTSGMRGSAGMDASDQHSVFSENRSAVTSTENAEDRSSLSSSRNSASSIGAAIASEYSGTDSRALSLALSKGIVNASRDSSSERSEHSTGGGREKKFTRSLTQLSQLQAVSSAISGTDWRQSVDLRSFAYDARDKFGTELDDLRDSVTATASGSAALHQRAADFQQRYGITDRVTAGDMALLELAHEGNDEQRASVLGIWAMLNRGDSGQVVSGTAFSSVLSDGLSSEFSDFGSSPGNSDRVSGMAEKSFREASVRVAELSATGDSIRSEFAAGADATAGIFLRKTEDSSSAAVDAAISSRVSVISDSGGKPVLYAAGMALDPDMLDRVSDGFLGRAVSAIGDAVGDRSRGVISRALTDSAFGSQIKGELMRNLDPDLRDIVTSSEPVPQDPAGIRTHPGLREYAARHGFDLDNDRDMERLSYRSRLLAMSQSDYHRGNVINFAIDTSAMLSVQTNDDLAEKVSGADGKSRGRKQ